MSAFYHICPSNNNFQFGMWIYLKLHHNSCNWNIYLRYMVFHIDTAFMFIIGGLLIVKIFQSRHSDLHSDAFVAFFCLAVVILLTLIGIVRVNG